MVQPKCTTCQISITASRECCIKNLNTCIIERKKPRPSASAEKRFRLGLKERTAAFGRLPSGSRPQPEQQQQHALPPRLLAPPGYPPEKGGRKQAVRKLPPPPRFAASSAVPPKTGLWPFASQGSHRVFCFERLFSLYAFAKSLPSKRLRPPSRICRPYGLRLPSGFRSAVGLIGDAIVRVFSFSMVGLSVLKAPTQSPVGMAGQLPTPAAAKRLTPAPAVGNDITAA